MSVSDYRDYMRSLQFYCEKCKEPIPQGDPDRDVYKIKVNSIYTWFCGDDPKWGTHFILCQDCKELVRKVLEEMIEPSCTTEDFNRKRENHKAWKAWCKRQIRYDEYKEPKK